MAPLTRRQFIGTTAGMVVASSALSVRADAITINPRSSWAEGLPPKGSLDGEDVKFLIVHHSASHNGHQASDVPGILRGWYHYHTGPEKNWPDIAYNFIIDSAGGVWEGRMGSVDGSIAGSATGGNQGFTQLVCVIGDTNLAPPTAAAKRSLVAVLAWLAKRYDVSTAPGAEVTFTSRGSNRWPAGASVTTATLAGHRDMSKTSCPGDNLYGYVTGSLSGDVEAARGGSTPPPPPPATTTTALSTTTSPPTTVAPTTTTPPPTTLASTTTTTLATTTTTEPTVTSLAVTSSSSPTTIPAPPSTISVAGEALPTGSGAPGGLIATAATMLVGGAGLLLWRRSRMQKGD